MAWRESESLKPGDLIVCNNSFLFREGTPTNKNAMYLGIEVDVDDRFCLPPVVVSMGSRINLQFKRLQPKEIAKYQVDDLRATVAQELPRLGSIIFSLVGRIGEAESAQVDLPSAAGVRVLEYRPGQSRPVELSGDVMSISAIDDLDTVWSAVQARVVDTDIEVSALGEAFEGAFHALQEAATLPVDPTDVAEDAPSIVGRVLERMQEQVNACSVALRVHRERPGDNDAYNELLRIAYNFADGARSFMGLMVGICDLKPLVSWLTVFEQIDLAHRFGQLPFSLVGKGKPSLERYRSVIADARNRAFHDVFAFDHPFIVRLPGDAIRAPELRLFRDYNKRKEPALTFEDRRLVELFQGLTRTSERPVPLGFWDGNQLVMEAVVAVVRALHRSLVLVRAA